jgi:hypothetical protein
MHAKITRLLMHLHAGLFLIFSVSMSATAALASDVASVVVPKLREFCQACHAVGDSRFIRSDDDQVVWRDLFSGIAPKRGKLWAEAIVEVLDWPSDSPPDFSSPIEPGRDWMPKGSKRLPFADDKTNGESTRRLLLRELRSKVATGANESLSGRCAPAPRLLDPSLTSRNGYLDFMRPSEQAEFKDLLPEISDASLNAVMRSPDTMWYDEDTMAFAYQDSVESVTGVRANCVGRQTGEDNPNNPGIFKLTKYFGPDFRFREPFRKAAGTNLVDNSKVINFWAPPRDASGKVIPVRYWRDSARGRWRWAFPVDTIFGEVLLQADPQGNFHVFEIRTRKRYLQGWGVNMFRPFRTASDMSLAIRSLRPNWLVDPNLVEVVRHLDNPDTLRPHSMKSVPFAKIFPEIKGALDEIPVIADPTLVVALLHRRFVSVEGAVWKESGDLLTYAPASAGDFSIVPRGYEMGLIPVNDESCSRCHVETGRRLGQLDRDIVLYGEVWGEDQIFTWHLFEPNSRIFATFDEVDGSRVVNPRMVNAGLVVPGQPPAGSNVWKALPSGYDKPAPK